MRVNAQAENFNRSGRARTRDDMMVTREPPPDSKPRSKKVRAAATRGRAVPQPKKGRG